MAALESVDIESLGHPHHFGFGGSRLLANSDRHADDGVFNRDVIDLAMMALPLRTLRAASAKAEQLVWQRLRALRRLGEPSA